MPNYELVVVCDGGQNDDAIRGCSQRIREILATQEAEITYVEEWGRRRLAYPINKKSEGFYTVFYFRTPAGKDPHNELDRFSRINEVVIRHLLVNVPKLKTEADARREEALREAERKAAADARARSAAAYAERTAAAAQPAVEAPVAAPADAPEESAVATAPAEAEQPGAADPSAS